MRITETHLGCTLSKSFPRNFLRTRVTNLRAPAHEVAWRVFTLRTLWISSQPKLRALFRPWRTSLSIPLERLLPKIHEWYLISCSYAHVAFIPCHVKNLTSRLRSLRKFPLAIGQLIPYPPRGGRMGRRTRILCINLICIWNNSV